MENLIINYFNSGLYDSNDLQVFVAAGELSQDTYNKLTNTNNAESSDDSSDGGNNSSASSSNFNPVK